jgi:very-long-chain (3R)-3-hydroxyacyl-CoA dehydratase
MLEILHSLLGWVKSSALTTTVQVLGRNFILFGILMVESKMQDREIVWCLFLTWSVIEIVRYPYYLLATVKKEWGFVTWLRYTLWIPLYPVGFMFEGLVMLISMPIFEKSEKWNLDLPNRLNISFHFLTFIRIYMLFYVPGIYLLMQRMYEQRKKKIKMISPAKKFPLATRKKKKT